MSEGNSDTLKGLSKFTAMASQLLVGVVAAAYVTGFIVVNTGLATIGARSFDAFQARYLIVGFIFLAVLTFYGFAAARRVYFWEHDAARFRDALKSQAGLWGFVSELSPVVETIFATMYVALFASVFLFHEGMQASRVLYVCTALFIFDFFVLVKTRAYVNRLRLVLVLNILIHSAIVVWSLVVIPVPAFSRLFIFFLGSNFMIYFWVQVYGAKVLPVHIFALGGFLALASLSFGFGALFYEDLKAEIGGGQPVPVSVLLSPDAPPELTDFTRDFYGPASLLLVGEAGEHIFLMRETDNPRTPVYRLESRFVSAIVTNPIGECVDEYVLQDVLPLGPPDRAEPQGDQDPSGLLIPACPDADGDAWADCTTNPTCNPYGHPCGDCDDANSSVNPNASSPNKDCSSAAMTIP